MIFAGAKICGAKICGAKMIFVFFCRSFHHRPGAKICGAMTPRARGAYYYLLQRKNANIRGTVADHEVVTPDPICSLTMFSLEIINILHITYYILHYYLLLILDLLLLARSNT